MLFAASARLEGRTAGEESAALTTATIHSSLSMVPLDRAHSLGFCAEDEGRRAGREEGTGRETSEEDAVGVLQNFYDMDAHRSSSLSNHLSSDMKTKGSKLRDPFSLLHDGF